MSALDANLHDFEHLGRAVDDALVDGGNTATGVECVLLTGSTIILPAVLRHSPATSAPSAFPAAANSYSSPKTLRSSASSLPVQCKEHSDAAVQGGTSTSFGSGSPHRQRLANAR